jgi:hypothetical protein
MRLNIGDQLTLRSNQVQGNYVREKTDTATGQVSRYYDRHFAVPGRYTVVETIGDGDHRLIILRSTGDKFEVDEYCLRAILGEWSEYEQSSETFPGDYRTSRDAEEYESMRDAERDMESAAEDRITGFIRD